MTNTDLFYLVGRCLSLPDFPEHREQIVRAFSTQTFNWENFTELCSNHLILQVVFLNFKKCGILKYLPVELQEFLAEVYQLNVERNNKILDQLSGIIRTLNQNNIYPTLLKGTGNLFDKLYDDPGIRMIGDIDILVAENEYLEAAKILGIDGYDHLSQPFFNPEEMKHFPKLFKDGMVADVEIHRIPVDKEFHKKYNSEVINREKRQVQTNGLKFFVLSDKHKMVHNFIHAQLSNKGHAFGLVPFRDMYDVYLLSKRIKINHRIEEIQHQRIAKVYFEFIDHVFGTPDFNTGHKSIGFQIFRYKHDLFLRSRVLYRINKTLIYMSQRIGSYCWQILAFFFSSNMRKSFFVRLANKDWYINHWNTYLRFFFRRTINKKDSKG